MFRKVVLPTLVISGSFLTAFGVIIASQGSKSIEVRSDNEQVLNARVRDVFSPTMGVLLSAGIGLAAWTAIGCGYSLKKSNDLESQVTKLQNLIAEREKQIQALKLEPNSPMMSQLKWFIDEEPDQPQQIPDQEVPQAINSTTVDSVKVNSTTMEVRPPVEPVVRASSGFDYEVIRDSKPATQSAAMAFPSAQTGFGLPYKPASSQASNRNS